MNIQRSASSNIKRVWGCDSVGPLKASAASRMCSPPRFSNPPQMKGPTSTPPRPWTHLPVGEAQQDGPVEAVLQAGGLWATGVDEGVHGGQDEALLVQLLQLPRQLPHRRQPQRGRPT